MIMLLMTAIGSLVAGILAILYGIPVKEFSFGNTIILAGVIAVCTGLVLFGLWIATREMRAIARRIAAPASAGLHEPSLPELGAATVPSSRPIPHEPVVAVPPPVIAPAPPTYPPLQQTDIEDRPPPPDLAPTPVAAPEPPQKPRRNLLFESSVRKERSTAATSDAAPSSEAPQRTMFEDPIAQRGADRAERLQRARSPSTFAEPAPSAQPEITVLKSGVVDGMSYSLYSDGSIEAQMPEGMMRFASIDELRSHLDQREA